MWVPETGHWSPPPPSPGRSECRFEEGGCTGSEIPEWGPSPLSDHSLEEGPPEAGGGGKWPWSQPQEPGEVEEEEEKEGQGKAGPGPRGSLPMGGA